MRLASMTTVAAIAALASASAETILQENFEQQGKWKKVIRGKGHIELVQGGVSGKCVKITSQDKALAYYVLPLDVKRIRGKRVIVRAKVKLDNVVQGDRSYAMAKIKIMYYEGKKGVNRAYNFAGSQDWHDRTLLAEVSEAATRAELQLGIQYGTGTVYFDNLIVDDGVMSQTAVSLAPAANASYNGAVMDLSTGAVVRSPIDIRGLPTAFLQAGSVAFSPLPAGRNFGRTCIMLRGKSYPRLPVSVPSVIAVAEKAKRLYFLQAAAGVDASRKDPCLVYEVHYDDGQAVNVEMREGIDIGDVGQPKELANWKVGWTIKRGERVVALGVSEWTNPRPQAEIAYIRVSTPGAGAAPVLAAISLEPTTKTRKK